MKTITLFNTEITARPPLWWNELEKTQETDCGILPCDIIYQVGTLACLCQRKNNFNNLVVQAVKPAFANPKNMLVFCVVLYKLHGIRFVRVESVAGRYKFLTRSAPAVFTEAIPGSDRTALYFDLEACYPALLSAIGNYTVRP